MTNTPSPAANPGRKDHAMIKLNKPIDMLEKILEQIDEKIEALTAKQEAIVDKACNADHDLTEGEMNRYDALQEKIDELEGEKDDIECALDYLRDYWVA